MKPEERWQKTASRFRKHLPEPVPETAPHGFATRVAALADLKKTTPLILRLRAWSLGTAAASGLALILLLSLREPQKQFLPVPELNLPNPAKP